jgi:TonB family protein
MHLRCSLAVGVVVVAVSTIAAGSPTPLQQTQTPPPAQNPTPLPADEFLIGVYRETTPGIVVPRVQKRVNPKFPETKRGATINETVFVQVVVLADGTVGRTRVTNLVQPKYGLDVAARTAVEQWIFEPGKLNGQPVPVAKTFTFHFTTK